MGILAGIEKIGDVYWTYFMAGLLIIVGVYFTYKLGFRQIRMIPEMVRLITGKDKTVEEKKVEKSASKKGNISSFQAFCVSVASYVGTGNIAGVAIALIIGGPGALFWMWVIAILGGATSIVENILGQTFKIKTADGYRGGPAYYISNVLKQKKLGVVFSVIVIVTYGLIFNSVQANTINQAFNGSFNISPVVGAIIICVLSSAVIFGGLKRIADTATLIVPVMALSYIGVAILVILFNIDKLPHALNLIFSSAFDFRAGSAAVLATIVTGVKRGMFSNEAGMGSAPNASSTSEVSHPAKQALMQASGVFISTILICSASAFIILLSPEYSAGSGLEGIKLVQASLSSFVGSWGSLFITVCLFMFAYSSIIGNYYLGENNITFLTDNKTVIWVFRFLVVVMLFVGSVAELKIVWAIADIAMGIMALVNIYAITRLSKTAFKVFKDYIIQRKEGKEPVFVADDSVELSEAKCWK